MIAREIVRVVYVYSITQSVRCTRKYVVKTNDSSAARKFRWLELPENHAYYHLSTTPPPCFITLTFFFYENDDIFLQSFVPTINFHGSTFLPTPKKIPSVTILYNVGTRARALELILTLKR